MWLTYCYHLHINMLNTSVQFRPHTLSMVSKIYLKTERSVFMPCAEIISVLTTCYGRSVCSSVCFHIYMKLLQVVDSMVVERARGEPQSTSGSLQSLCWGSSAIGGVMSAYFSGSLVDTYGVRFAL